MISLLFEVVTAAVALAASLAAVWHKLRAERYCKRWRAALNLSTDSELDGLWRVELDGRRSRPQWVVTNGEQVAARLDADFEYPSLAPKARASAEQLAKDLNAGKVRVAA